MSRHRALVLKTIGIGLAFGMQACDAGSNEGGPSEPDGSGRALAARRAEEREVIDRATVEQLLADKPGGQRRIERMRRGVALDSKELRPAGDGNYFVSIEDGHGGQREVMTQGQRFSYADLAASLRRNRSKEHRLETYQSVYASLPAAYVREAGLAAPEQLRGETSEQLRARNHSIALDVDRILAMLPPSAEKPLTNEGSGSRDGSSSGDGIASCSRSANSLWELSPASRHVSATRIKDQGARGTCVSFALTAAVETGVAELHGTFLNLSEQGLYGKAKAVWNEEDFGDGLSTLDTVDEITNGYTFLSESDWTYNPSWSRTSDEDEDWYLHSCDDYSGRHCSNTTHQGDWSGDHWLVSAPQDSGVTATSATEFDADDDGVELAKVVVASHRRGVIFSLETTHAFNHPWNGYLLYAGDDEDTLGNHATLIVGFANNSQLPSSSPPGAGGGYFIVKNSWGCGYGDGGFVYVPYRWVTEYGNSLSVVHVN